MILLPFLYIWLAEPMGFQKEASVREFMAQLAEEYVMPEHQHFVRDAKCALNGEMTRAINQSDSWMKGISVIECRAETPCGTTIERPVWHRPFEGAFITADPFWETVGTSCYEMLNESARAKFDHWASGG